MEKQVKFTLRVPSYVHVELEIIKKVHRPTISMNKLILKYIFQGMNRARMGKGN